MRNQCFHCGAASVNWEGDFSFEDYGYEGEGIVQICRCANCGALIEYQIPCNAEAAAFIGSDWKESEESNETID